MRTLFKNPWMWLLIFFPILALVVGIGIFGNAMSRSVEMSAERGRGSFSDDPSRDEADSLVQKLEAGNDVPEENSDKWEEIGPDGNVDASVQAGNDADKKEGLSDAATLRGSDAVSDNDAIEAVDAKNDGMPMDVSEESISVQQRLVSWGFSKSESRNADTVVIHSTYNAIGGDPFSVEKIIGIYKQYGVSPHYLIARDGTVYLLVAEHDIAYHAGDSRMKDGRSNVNAFSLGIEIIGKDSGSPTKEQYASLRALLADIGRRNEVNHIVGHSDIAPGRKTDPWGFDWSEIGGKKL